MERGEQDFVLQWGYRKRLRCVKPQVKDDDKTKESHLFRRQPSRHDRVLRNFETSGGGGMKGNGVRTSPRERGGGGGGGKGEEGKGNKGTASIEAHDKKGGASSSSGSEAAAWPSIVIGLTNKEKEEDFMQMKGSKPPHRPKKRAKYLQKTINLVSPGAWLCDLTLERYEVREKKISKKRPRGLKAMGDVDSDSE